MVKSKKKKGPIAPLPQTLTWFGKLLRVWPLIASVIAAGSLGVAAAAFYYNFWRQPDLTMMLRATKFEAAADGTQRVHFDVVVENKGKKAAPQFYWHFLVPQDAVVGAEFQVGAQKVVPVKTYAPDGTKALLFEGQVTVPVHQGAVVFGALTMLMRLGQPVESRWQIICCDTKLFPEDAPASDKFGRLRVDPGSLERWQVIYSTPPRDLRVHP